MKNYLFIFLFLIVSCGDGSPSKANQPPDFGYHVDRIFNVAEDQIDIALVQATDPEGDAINYSVSNSDLVISEVGILSFISPPDYETQNEYLTEVTASNDAGSDQINVKVKVVDTLCEFDTAATFDSCIFQLN